MKIPVKLLPVLLAGVLFCSPVFALAKEHETTIPAGLYTGVRNEAVSAGGALRGIDALLKEVERTYTKDPEVNLYDLDRFAELDERILAAGDAGADLSPVITRIAA